MTSALLFAEMTEPQSALSFPEPLSERYRPSKIADFAGLNDRVNAKGEVIPGPKSVLSGFVKSPRNAGFLFCDPAGTGKTSMALALATELQAFRHHIPAGCCTVDKVREVVFSCWYVAPAGYKRHMIHIDEADLMSPAAQNAILSYIDGTNTIPDCVWVFTCNG